jgi:hypothetical protein
MEKIHVGVKGFYRDTTLSGIKTYVALILSIAVDGCVLFRRNSRIPQTMMGVAH